MYYIRQDMSERVRIHEYGDLIRFDDERLQNISVEHSFGREMLERGWYSVLLPDGTYETKGETSDSSKTPFEPLILLVPPNLIGTHEATDPDHIPTEKEDKRGFEGVDFSQGWNGSPIAVACFAVCEGDKIIRSDIYPGIFKALSAHGGKGILDDLEYGDIGVLDGHHRRRYAAEGPVKLKYVPVQIIPYLYDPSVKLETWHLDGNCWEAQRVFECFKVPDQYADAKRTKFGVRGTDGITRRILNTQPNIKIPLKYLI